MPVTRSKPRRGARNAGPQSTKVKNTGKARPSKPLKTIHHLNPLPLPPVFLQVDKRRKVLVHGANECGQLGLGDDVDKITRPRIHKYISEMTDDGELGPSGIESVSAGGMFSLVLDSHGQIWSFGCNDQLSLGRPVKESDPSGPAESEASLGLVEGLDAFRAVKIATSDSHSLTLSDDGSLRAWGAFNGENGLLGFDGAVGGPKMASTPTSLPMFKKVPLSDISCGNNHALALSCSGRVYTWGSGEKFQLGRKFMTRRRENGLRKPEPLDLRNIVTIGTGCFTSFVVDAEGIVYAFGLNQMRQTGVSDDYGGQDEMIEFPTQVEALHPSKHNGARVVQIAGGEHHTIFLLDDGEVWGCGRSDDCRLGLAEDYPAMLDIERKYEEELASLKQKAQTEAKAQARARASRSCSTDDNNDAEDDESPAARDLERFVKDTRIAEPIHIPFQIEGATSATSPRIASIASGERYSLACDENGEVYCWGVGTSHQLGLGPTQIEAETPTLLQNTALRTLRVHSMSAGGQHVLLCASER